VRRPAQVIDLSQQDCFRWFVRHRNHDSRVDSVFQSSRLTRQVSQHYCGFSGNAAIISIDG
jgi:hypothetical protein